MRTDAELWNLFSETTTKIGERSADSTSLTQEQITELFDELAGLLSADEKQRMGQLIGKVMDRINDAEKQQAGEMFAQAMGEDDEDPVS